MKTTFFIMTTKKISLTGDRQKEHSHEGSIPQSRVWFIKVEFWLVCWVSAEGRGRIRRYKPRGLTPPPGLLEISSFVKITFKWSVTCCKSPSQIQETKSLLSHREPYRYM